LQITIRAKKKVIARNSFKITNDVISSLFMSNGMRENKLIEIVDSKRYVR